MDLSEAIKIFASYDHEQLAPCMRVLAGVQTLIESGDNPGPGEFKPVLEALNIGASHPSVKEGDREELLNIKQVVEHELLAREALSSTEFDMRAKFMGAEEKSEGLEWDIRVIRSGITIDKRDYYPPQTLEEAVDLFDGVQCFADHYEGASGPVLKLIGWISDPHIVKLEDGVAIDATLHVLESSPAFKLLREMYVRGVYDKVGLSISAIGQARYDWIENRQVRIIEKLERILSVDLVSKPNAGGSLIRLRESINKILEEDMKILERIKEEMEQEPQEEPQEEPVTEEATESVAEEAQPVTPQEQEAEPAVEEEDKYGYPEPSKADEEMMKLMKQLMDKIADLEKKLAEQKAKAAIADMVEKADLPEPLAESVRAQLDELADIQEAQKVIENAKRTWATAIEVAAAQQPVIRVTSNPKQKILRLQALIAGEKIDDAVEPYSSLREAYADITGRPVWRMTPREAAAEMVRASFGFNSEVIRETVETGDWSYALGQALHRELIRQYQLPRFDDWRKVVSRIAPLRDMRTNDRLRYSYFNTLSSVSEGGTYQEFSDPSEERAYYSPTKYGGLASWTWEAALNDDLNVLADIPRRLALAAKLTVWYNVLNIFAATSPPTCTYDSTALFHADHSNLVTVNLTSANFGAARKALMTQTAPGASSMYLGAEPKYLLVPPDLEATARKLRDSDVDIDSTTVDMGNPWKGTFDIIVIPFWSDTNAWAVVADPTVVPTIEVGFLGGKEEPELYTEASNTGSAFTADKVTYKIRHVWGYVILDHRGMYKSNGAT